MVLRVKELLTFGTLCAHIANASSPVLRTNVFVTVELVTPVWKFTPSAVWSRIRLLRMVKLSIGPSIHAPTFVFSSQRLSTTELVIAPPRALTWSSSTRSRMSPMMAKSRSVTLRLGPFASCVRTGPV
ncbi:hypothetical protein ONO86_00169 [Micromonospora noduli]|nr:hypothetical protein ONO86_00169 [Micromonospora noduli]